VVDLTLSVAALAVEPDPLTPRKLDVLRLAAEGASEQRSPRGCT
jgi:DNA-binding CsgD family transcriptional regulator